MRVVASCSSKGGTGKTSFSIHMATGLAREGHRVLLADVDPQGSATAWLLGEEAKPERGMFDALRARRLDGCVMRLEERKLDFVAANKDLRELDLLLASNPATGWSALRDALAKGKAKWDYVFLDCPPNVNMGTMNAICAADGVVAPLVSGTLSLVGLAELEETIERLRATFRVKARMLGYVIFQADVRTSVTSEMRETLAARGYVYKAQVRISTAATTMSKTGATAWDAGVDPRGLEDYRAVLKETVTKLKAVA